MKGFYVAEMGHVVNVLPPKDITGGATGDRFHLKNYAHATIIIQIGASAAAFAKILIRECNAESGGTAVEIPFKLYAEETPAGDTLGPREDVTAAGRTPSANDNITYVAEIDASELSEGSPWIELALPNGANSVIASAVAILSGARHASDQSPTAIA